MVKFDNVFRKKHNQIMVPPILLDEMSKGLPESLMYKATDNGECVVMPRDNVPLKIEGLDFVLPKKYKELLNGESHTLELLQQYSYNAQKKIKLKLIDGEFVIINGQKVKPTDLVKFPYKDQYVLSGGAFYMIPSKFSDPYPISVGDGKIEKFLMVQRKPNESIWEAKYESDKNNSLQLSYLINEKTKQLRFNFIINLKHAKSIAEIIDTIKIFYAFREGTGYIFGSPQPSICTSSTGQDNFNLTFWEHVRDVERALNITFKPPRRDITNNEAIKLEELYQMLILQKPIKNIQTLSSFSVTVSKTNNVEESLQHPIYIEFQQTVKERIFSAKVNYFLLNGIFNGKIDSIEPVNNDKKVVLKPCNDSPIYTVKIAFTTENALQKYLDAHVGMHVPEMEKAKTVLEILSDKAF